MIFMGTTSKNEQEMNIDPETLREISDAVKAVVQKREPRSPVRERALKSLVHAASYLAAIIEFEEEERERREGKSD